MNSLIQSFIDFLIEGHGLRDTPGWIYILGIISSVVGTISAKTLLAKRRALRAEKAVALSTKELHALLIAEEDGSEVKYSAFVKRYQAGIGS